MKSINALSFTPGVARWLANSRDPHILHIFDRACNLIDERGEVLSIVTPKIGNGPFTLVVAENDSFFDQLNLRSPVSVWLNSINIGFSTIQITDADLWSPRPDWETLHQKREVVLNQVWEITNSQLPISPFNQSLISNLSSALATLDTPTVKAIASKLAGLGPGLTPSGDDFLLGAMYAAWIIHPPDVASLLSREIVDTAAPLTTSLSAAWLRAAGRGEAGCVWHACFEALLAEDQARIQASLNEILAVGATSGADALAGFVVTLTG